MARLDDGPMKKEEVGRTAPRFLDIQMNYGPAILSLTKQTNKKAEKDKTRFG